MRNLFYTLLFVVFARQATAQNNQFDYQVQRIDSLNYEMNLQLTSPEQVQFIRIHILDSGLETKIMEASLNQKRDRKYYLFLEGEEREVLPQSITISFDHQIEGLGIELAPPVEPSLLVHLLDDQLNIIESLQKIID